MILLTNFEKLIGLQVITSAAEILGEMKGARVDTKTWEIKDIHVKLSSIAADELRMKKRLGSSVISIPVSAVHAVSHVISLNKSMKELEGAGEIAEFRE